MTTTAVVEVYEWHIYCESEVDWVKGWGPIAITTCPHNTTHTVTAGSAQKLATFGAKSVKVIEYDPEVGQIALKGYKKMKTVHLRDDENDEDDYVLRGNHVSKMVWMSPKHPILIYSLKTNVTADQTGDVINLWATKDEVAGATATTVAQGATTLTVLAIPADYLTPAVYTGFKLKIEDGSGEEDLGDIVDVDEANHTVSFENATTRAFAAYSLLKVSVHTIDNLIVGCAGPMNFGDDLQGALGYIKPLTPVTVWYQRNNPRPITCQVQLQIGTGAKKVL